MRALEWAASDTELFALVLATHPEVAPAAGLLDVVKYSRAYGRTLATIGDPQVVLDQADEAIRNALGRFGDPHVDQPRVFGNFDGYGSGGVAD